jgi:hypothetical protein
MYTNVLYYLSGSQLCVSTYNLEEPSSLPQKLKIFYGLRQSRLSRFQQRYICYLNCNSKSLRKKFTKNFMASLHETIKNHGPLH